MRRCSTMGEVGAPRLPERTEVEELGLVVRTWTLADAPAINAAVQESIEHLRPWMPWVRKEPLTLEARRELIEGWRATWAAGGDAVYGILRGDTVVGGTGLHRRIGEGGLEIGYWVHVDHLRQGIVTATSRALTDLAFTVPDIDHVEIHHDVANEISRRIPARLGYTEVGEIDAPEGDRADAETDRHVVWRITRDEWQALRDR